MWQCGAIKVGCILLRITYRLLAGKANNYTGIIAIRVLGKGEGLERHHCQVPQNATETKIQEVECLIH